MANALKNYVSTPQGTSQRQKADDRQVKNSAGGYVFATSDEQTLTRFLVLGTEGGTYYVNERDLTKRNADSIIKMIKADEAKVVNTLVDVSVNARAPKNSHALFVLALVFVHGSDKKAATDALVQVARTATHLFEFVSYLKGMGGLGRSKQRAISQWYLSKTPEQVAFQAVKYRSRNGFTHKDMLALAHPKGLDKEVGNFILGKEYGEVPEVINAYAAAARATSVKDAKAVIAMFRQIPWEAFPTSLHSEKEFWKALFEAGSFGQTALVRNVTRWAKLGLFDDVKFAGDVAKRLSDPEAIAKGRMHPVAYLNALKIYQSGRTPERNGYSMRYYYGSGHDWKVNAKIAGALEKGFYEAFKSVTPSGKRTMVSLDVSGSMTSAAPAGLVGLSCMEAATAMAMVTVRTEPYVVVNRFDTRLSEVNISDADSLETAYGKIYSGALGTDVSKPIEHALKNKLEIDHFVIYTDNETWAGRRHPHEALADYRRKMGIDARVTVVGMASNGFTVADDSGNMLDVVGFDSSAPAVISDFGAHRI